LLWAGDVCLLAKLLSTSSPRLEQAHLLEEKHLRQKTLTEVTEELDSLDQELLLKLGGALTEANTCFSRSTDAYKMFMHQTALPYWEIAKQVIEEEQQQISRKEQDRAAQPGPERDDSPAQANEMATVAATSTDGGAGSVANPGADSETAQAAASNVTSTSPSPTETITHPAAEISQNAQLVYDEAAPDADASLGSTPVADTRKVDPSPEALADDDDYEDL